MNLKDLAKPFPENQIEWRIGQCGEKGNGQIWANCLAYVTARAVMERLDEVCGPENWQVHYRFENGGVICVLTIRVGKDDWVSKEDGSDQTDIEAFKGGISGALKRAAVAFGIGRYLYGLESGYATIVDRGGMWAKTKSGKEFYWEPPKLPQWALPADQKSQALPQVKPDQPGANDGHLDDTGTYYIPGGTYHKKTIEQVLREIGPAKLEAYVIGNDEKWAKLPPSKKPQWWDDFANRVVEIVGDLQK